MAYEVAWEWQRTMVADRSAGRCGDTLILLEHPLTITLGRAACAAHILRSPDELAQHGVALVQSDRGGDVTLHAPGQLVGYPILKLSGYGGGVLHYLRSLEEVIIRVLATYGLVGERVEGLTGVWVGDAKVAAIGVKVSAGGVSSHGFALNVTPNMDAFQHIVPCGIADRGVTSLALLMGDNAPPMVEVQQRVVEQFSAVFGVRVVGE